MLTDVIDWIQQETCAVRADERQLRGLPLVLQKMVSMVLPKWTKFELLTDAQIAVNKENEVWITNGAVVLFSVRSHTMGYLRRPWQTITLSWPTITDWLHKNTRLLKFGEIEKSGFSRREFLSAWTISHPDRRPSGKICSYKRRAFSHDTFWNAVTIWSSNGQSIPVGDSISESKGVDFSIEGRKLEDH